MTTIRDYCDSIRQSLTEIEQLTDADQEPDVPPNEINFGNLDAIAAALASRYRRLKNGRCQREQSKAEVRS